MRLHTVTISLVSIVIIALAAGVAFYTTALRNASLEHIELDAQMHLERINALLSARLDAHQNTASVLAAMPQIVSLLQDRNERTLRSGYRVLDSFKEVLGFDVCYLMTPSGKVVASSNRFSPTSFEGNNYGFRPYFQQAIKGIKSIYVAVGVTSKKRGLYFGHPVYGSKAKSPIGVAVIKVALTEMEQEVFGQHHQYDGHAFVASPEGIILLSDDPALLLHTLDPMSPSQIEAVVASRQFGTGPFVWSGLKVVSKERMTLGDDSVFMSHALPLKAPQQWVFHHLVDIASVGDRVVNPLAGPTGSIGILILTIILGSVVALYHVARKDILQRRQAEQSLTRQTQYLSALHKTALDIMRRLDISSLSDSVLSHARNITDSRFAFLFLKSSGGRVLEMRGTVGDRFRPLIGLRLVKGAGVAGTVWQTAKSLQVDCYQTWEGRMDQSEFDSLQAVVGVPLFSENEVIGVIVVATDQKDSVYQNEDLQLLRHYAEWCSLAFENASLHQLTEEALKRRESALANSQERENQVKALLAGSRAVLQNDQFTVAACQILAICMRLTGAADGYLAVLDGQPDREDIIVLGDKDLHHDAPCTAPLKLPIGNDRRLKYEQPQIAIHNGLNGNKKSDIWPILDCNHQNLIVIPILNDQQAVGMIGLANRTDGFDTEDVRLVEAFGEQVALAMRANRSKAALLRSETRFRSVIEKNVDAIMVIDRQGKVLLANPAAHRLFAHHKGELVGNEFGLPLATDESTEIEILGLNNQLSKAELRLVQVEWEGDKAYLATLRDITERTKAEEEKKELERQLQRTQKMEAIGTLAGGIAHDFNNILSAVIGFSEISLEMLEEGSPLEDNLHEVLLAGQRARDLVKQILAFSRQADQERQPVQVMLLVKEVLKLLRASLPATIEIHQRIESKSAIYADPTQIHQLLMNLCTNAGHAMRDKGGRLSVSLKDVALDKETVAQWPEVKPGPFQRLVIADTGCGIDPLHLDRIFDPFFTTKQKGEGTGMGLAVVDGIVRGLGGGITVESQIGRGTRFTVHLPMIQKAKKVRQQLVEPLPRGKERILFIDDEPALVKMGRQLLERLGYTVETRTSSIEALALFRAKPNHFDAVISDVTMPKLTGDQLARKILALRKDIPVILCTGYSQNLAEEQIAALGIRALINKPILRREIAHLLREALDGDADTQRLRN